MKKLLLTLMLSLNGFGHGDHSIPGAVPPAPGGGALKEAKHLHKSSHKHNHKKASKKQVFFEASLKNDILEVSFLELEPKDDKFFIAHDFKEMKDVSITIKDARKNKKIEKVFELKDKKMIADFKGIRSRRIILDIKGKYQGAMYSAKIQVEKK